jgi:red chlorophyll catabolite reductase
MVINHTSLPMQVSFVLGSWLHCKLTSATTTGTLDIATIIVMLGPETDAPHFMLELIRNGSSSLVLLLDLLPRKDVVSDPAYLARFYDEMKLEKQREALERLPQSKVYVPSSLYVRSLVSPTAMLYKFKPLEQEKPGARSADELDLLVNDVLYPTSMQVFFKWLHAFRHRARRVHGDESRMLHDRDSVIKEMGIEIDLRSNMPRLFGHDITHRVIQAYRNGV